MLPFSFNYNHENSVFYGKTIGKFTSIEHDLLLNDILLLLSKKVGSSRQELVPIIAMRYTLISQILKIDVDNRDISEVCEEIDNSIYSFDKFQDDMEKNCKEFGKSQKVHLN